MTARRLLHVIAPFSILAACAAPQTQLPSASTPSPTTQGLAEVMGKPAETAISLLGQPALDRKEGEARQLQFSGTCILDLYYYPKASTGPVATYGEARLVSGEPLAADACLRRLLKR